MIVSSLDSDRSAFGFGAMGGGFLLRGGGEIGLERGHTELAIKHSI